MLNLIFTLDYEIHGNGDGCPLKLMVNPTYKLMDLMESYGAKLTIFADMAEILKFKEYYENTNIDKFHYLDIKEQLQEAVLRGHDVQLHVHSSFLKARYDGKRWQQHWPDYNLAGLEYEEIFKIIKSLKSLLETIIREKVPQYNCYAFRAANWSMHPTKNIARALLANRIYIDSSVYKYGRQNSWVNYDYSNAYDASFPYLASINDICSFDKHSRLIEFPIHCELRPLIQFITPMRIFRILRAELHKHQSTKTSRVKKANNRTRPKLFKVLKLLFIFWERHPMKYDFNQLTVRKMIALAKKLNKTNKSGYITLIAHSKSFIAYNTLTLGRFLDYLSKNSSNYTFSTFPKTNAL